MDKAAKFIFFRDIPLFESLDDNQMTMLCDMVQYCKVPRFTNIYLENEAADAIYFLSKGAIKIGVHSDLGKEVIKNILHPKAIFGELALISDRQRSDYAQALNTEVIYFKLKQDDFKTLMRMNKELSFKVINFMGKRLERIENKLESFIFRNARSRIIDFLKENALERGRQVGYELFFKHNLTQQDIANLTGTSRQTVTSVLNELKKLNLIHFNRNGVLIRDIAKLA
jgi:CRP-like cAMP-binding protein